MNMRKAKDVLKPITPLMLPCLLAARIALGSAITGPPASAPPPPPPVEEEEDPAGPGAVTGGGALGEINLGLGDPGIGPAPPDEEPVYAPVFIITPEPATFPLMFAGLAALGWRRLRR